MRRRIVLENTAAAVVQPTPVVGGTADYTRAPLGLNYSGGTLMSQTIINFIKAKNFRGPILLNGWDTNARDQLQAAGIPCIFYMDLSSIRDDNVGGNGPVAYQTSQVTDETWFMHRSGARYDQSGYGGQHWANMAGAGGHSGWQDAWAARAKARTIGTPWSGLMADNDMPSSNDYYGYQPNDEGSTIANLPAGALYMLQTAGPGMVQAGKILMPNVTEPWLEAAGLWQQHTTPGNAGWLEMFLGYTTDDNGGYQDPGTMRTQMGYISTTGASGTGVAMMRGPSIGRKRALFNYACFLIGGGSAYGAFFGGDDTYRMDPSVWWQPEMGMLVGSPSGSTWSTPATNGVTRTMSNGWAAANLNAEGGASITFTVPVGLLLPSGAAAPTSVTLMPHYGVVYKAS